MGEKRNANRFLDWRPHHGLRNAGIWWVGNIKTDITEIVCVLTAFTLLRLGACCRFLLKQYIEPPGFKKVGNTLFLADERLPYFQKGFSGVESVNYNLVYTAAVDHSARAVWGVGLDHFDTGVVGSNSARGMAVCPRTSVFCCPL
jgi:hypothetical protein